MSRTFSRFLLMMAVACGMLLNQAAHAEDPPSPPYLNSLPDFAHYEMIANVGPESEHGKSGKAIPYLTRLEVKKTGDTRQYVGTFSDGKTLEGWLYKGLVLLQQLSPPTILINTLENTTSNLPLAKEDFRELDWLGTENFKSVVTYNGKKCFLFEKMPNSDGARGTIRAWVDVTTKLPEAIEQQGIVYRFQYDPAPEAPLQLSPTFAKAWENYQGSAQAITVSAPTPPFVNRLPDFARYEMFEIPRTDAKSDPQKIPLHLTRVTVRKTGTTKQIIGEMSNGKSIEAWIYNGLVLLQQVEPPAILLNTLENTMSNLPIGIDDFKDLDWLAASDYKSMTTHEGAKCYVFERTSGIAAVGGPLRALIDVKTKLPVTLERQGFTYGFKFDDPPTQALQLSPEFAKAWTNYQNSLRAVKGRSGPR